MLQIYSSNLNENLVAVAAEIIRVQPLSRPLAAEQILVQSHGMATWLKQELAINLSVASAIECSKPAAFFWQLANKLYPGQEPHPRFEKDTLRWHLYETLPNKMSMPAYAMLFNYLNFESDKTGSEIEAEQNRALFNLSDLVADLYDAYQNYRPEWIEAWENGKDMLSHCGQRISELENWQSDLWRSIYSDIDEKGLDRVKSLELMRRELKRLSAEQKSQLPERIFVFGLSALPPQWFEQISDLSEYCDVHLLVQNPCRHYWGDVQTAKQKLKHDQSLQAKGLDPESLQSSLLEENELLAAWGKIGKDYLSLIYCNERLQEFSGDLFTESDSQHALSKLQGDLLELTTQSHDVSADDLSIRFARCHSPLREIEALHDYLLYLLQVDKNVMPKDIVVMMPNVQEYASYIEAIFSRSAKNTAGQILNLPFSISDHSLSYEQEISGAIEQLLKADQMRFTVTEVIDLLALTPIASAFLISAEELDQLTTWIEDLSVHWGLSDLHQAQMLEAPTDAMRSLTNWSAMIKKLMGGMIYGTEDVHTISGVDVLLKPVHNIDDMQLVGKLAAFIQALEDVVSAMGRNMSLIDWVDWTMSFFDRFVARELVSIEYLNHFDSALSSFIDQATHANFTGSISWSIFRSALLKQLDQEKVGQRFLSGKINFCTLMPMRSIPFKVVCLLGMNEGKYPRPEIKNSFDLLRLSPGKLGDRSRRDDDQYLFLEAVCSAREYLYVSYEGNSVRDNSEKFPSIMLSQLQDYCAQHFSICDSSNQLSSENVLSHWTWQHRLHGFSPAYYSPEGTSSERVGLPPYRSFSREWPEIIQGQGVSHVPVATHVETKSSLPNQLGLFDLEQEEGRAFHLDELVSFVGHPLRYYYQNVLQVSYSRIVAPIEEVEPFGIDSFQAYQFKNDYLESIVAAKTFSADEDFSEAVHSSHDERNEQPYEKHASKLERLKRRLMFSGAMAVSPVDQIEFNSLLSELEPLQQDLDRIDSFYTVNLTVELASGCVDGRVNLAKTMAGPLKLMEMHIGKRFGRVFFGFWIRHLFVNACRNQLTESNSGSAIDFNSRLVGSEKEIQLPPLDQELARSYLQEITQAFTNLEQGLSELPFLLPNTLFSQLFETPTKAKVAYEGGGFGQYSMQGEMGDEYWGRALKEGLVKFQFDGESELPAVEAQLLAGQVLKHIDSIKVLKR